MLIHYLLDAAQCFCQLLVLAAEGDADVSLAVAAEDKSRGDEYTRLVQHAFRQLLHIGTGVGYFAPEEHAYLVFIVCASQGVHDFACQPAAVAVVGVVAVIPVVFGFQCSGGGELHGAEHAAVDVAFHFQYPLHEVGIRGKHADTPARHVVALAHGVELYATLLGAGDAEDTDGVFVQDEAVGVVVHDDDVLAAGKVYQLPV